MIQGLNHLTLAVKDVKRAFDFYKNVLGLTPLCQWDKGAYFLVGDNFWFCLSLDPYRQPSPCHTHYAFSISQENFEPMVQKIKESGGQIFKENNSPGDSLYFLDPDGHKLEIHVGDWQSRIASKKREEGPWQNVTWFV